MVAVTAQGSLGTIPVTANTAGLGDLLAGPAIQWDKGTLLGRPVFQRVESDLTMPTGKYDSAKAANPGSNVWTLDSYYSFVWLFADKWETSLRLWYGFNSQNPDTGIMPGQRANSTFAVSREIMPKLRLGAAGYAFRQTTDDRLAGGPYPRFPRARDRRRPGARLFRGRPDVHAFAPDRVRRPEPFRGLAHDPPAYSQILTRSGG